MTCAHFWSRNEISNHFLCFGIVMESMDRNGGGMYFRNNKHYSHSHLCQRQTSRYKRTRSLRWFGWKLSNGTNGEERVCTSAIPFQLNLAWSTFRPTRLFSRKLLEFFELNHYHANIDGYTEILRLIFCICTIRNSFLCRLSKPEETKTRKKS